MIITNRRDSASNRNSIRIVFIIVIRIEHGHFHDFSNEASESCFYIVRLFCRSFEKREAQGLRKFLRMESNHKMSTLECSYVQISKLLESSSYLALVLRYNSFIFFNIHFVSNKNSYSLCPGIVLDKFTPHFNIPERVSVRHVIYEDYSVCFPHAVCCKRSESFLSNCVPL